METPLDGQKRIRVLRQALTASKHTIIQAGLELLILLLNLLSFAFSDAHTGLSGTLTSGWGQGLQG